MHDNASRTWFDSTDRDGVSIAAITDDLHLEINALGTVTICGWNHSRLQLDYNDVLDITDVLAEAVRILRLRFHRSAYPNRDAQASEL